MNALFSATKVATPDQPRHPEFLGIPVVNITDDALDLENLEEFLTGEISEGINTLRDLVDDIGVLRQFLEGLLDVAGPSAAGCLQAPDYVADKELVSASLLCEEIGSDSVDLCRGRPR